MALIKCKECGHMISDKATKCPKCGCPIMKQEEIRTSQASQDKVQQVQPAYYEQNNSGNSKKTLYAIIGVLMALLVGLGLWMWKSELYGVNESDKNLSESVDVKKIGHLDGTYLFRGEIGPYRADMSITLDGKDVTGIYHYDFQKAGVNMSLKGTIKEDGMLIMNEYTPSGKNSGRFDGTFTGKTFSGTFFNNTNGKQFPFKFLPTNALKSPSSNDNKESNEGLIDAAESASKDYSGIVGSSQRSNLSEWNISSAEELQNKIVGTIWTCRPAGEMWYRLEFSSSQMTLYYAEPQMGRWIGGQEHDRWSYTIEKSYTADTGEKCLSVQFRKSDDDRLSYGALFFLKGGNVEFSWLRGKYGGKAECKDFQWE